MRSVGKLEVVVHEMTRLNIRCLGLAETRWTGKGHFLSDTGCTVIYSGNDKLKAAGVAVLLDRGLGKSLLGYNPISERILTVRLAARPWNVTLIQVYAPTNQASDTTKDEFYSQTPKQDIVLLCGDFNAKIGEGAPIEKHALGVSNDNGERLTHFALSNRLSAANARQKCHLRHKYTWQSFDGNYRNQIDYILVQDRWLPSAGKCRSYPSADADTDHVMVKLKFRLRLKRITRPKSRTQYDFKQNEQNDQYRLELGKKFQLLAELGDSESENDAQGIGTDTEQLWQRLKVSILDSATETLSVKRTQPSQAWITSETSAVIEEKRRCPRDSDQYRRLKRQVRSSRNHLEGVGEEMEEYQKRNDSKGMFATVNRLTKQACPTVKLVKDNQRRTLTEDSEITERWREYCENLYSDSENNEQEQVRMGGTLEPTPP